MTGEKPGVTTVPTDDQLLNRLRRIEGQVRGLQRMVEEDRDCHKVPALISGIHSAVDAVGGTILEQCASGCRTETGDAVMPQDMVRALTFCGGSGHQHPPRYSDL